ncbi:MAG: hypothetical protein JKY34_06055 [Kordiimonadaceae bacterium]|nr:hypothetical protein [Kordiimonadaceae bacterium]
MTVFAKDPASTVDYSFDRAGWLTLSEGITSAVWSVDPPSGAAPTLGTEITVGTTRGIYVSGGVAGHRYRLSCKIETDAGRAAERSLIIRVMEV